MSQLLTAEAVRDVALACAVEPGQTPGLIVEGVTNRFGFSRERVQAHRPAIDALLAQLPDAFRRVSEGGGGGWSFLNACERADGVLWGEQHDVQMLLALGLAAGSVEYLLPRDLWASLPGGMPYFHILPPQPPLPDDAR